MFKFIPFMIFVTLLTFQQSQVYSWFGGSKYDRQAQPSQARSLNVFPQPTLPSPTISPPINPQLTFAVNVSRLEMNQPFLAACEVAQFPTESMQVVEYVVNFIQSNERQEKFLLAQYEVYESVELFYRSKLTGMTITKGPQTSLPIFQIVITPNGTEKEEELLLTQNFHCELTFGLSGLVDTDFGLISFLTNHDTNIELSTYVSNTWAQVPLLTASIREIIVKDKTLGLFTCNVHPFNCFHSSTASFYEDYPNLEVNQTVETPASVSYSVDFYFGNILLGTYLKEHGNEMVEFVRFEESTDQPAVLGHGRHFEFPDFQIVIDRPEHFGQLYCVLKKEKTSESGNCDSWLEVYSSYARKV